MPETAQTPPTGEPPAGSPDPEEQTTDHALIAAVATTAVTADSLSAYARTWWTRLKAGDSGSLPVIVGLVVLAVIFQSQDRHFLTAANLTNLMPQGAEYTLLALGVVFVLLLGEIDLSIGYVAGLAGTVAAELVKSPNPHSWWLACLAALGTATAIGLLQGLLITTLGLPSFVVTLAGYLGWQGVTLLILGNGGNVPIDNKVIDDFANGAITPAAGWIITVIGVVAYAAWQLASGTRRRSKGLATPPVTLIVLKIVLVAAVAVFVTAICNTNRGALVKVEGVPWVVLIVLGSLILWSFVLGRLRFGRYVYAIGGNTEAARRAGINVALVRTLVFGIAGFMAGVAGLVAASRLRSVQTSSDGGTAVLFAIAAAVIGGTSLFGGRGRAIHAILGGLVIAAIYNGMGLLGLSAAAQYVVTGLVLLVAVSVDALARRGRASAGVV
jgi:D-xylose transport system permease protein